MNPGPPLDPFQELALPEDIEDHVLATLVNFFHDLATLIENGYRGQLATLLDQTDWLGVDWRRSRYVTSTPSDPRASRATVEPKTLMHTPLFETVPITSNPSELRF